MKNVFKQSVFLAMVFGFAGQACAQIAEVSAQENLRPQRKREVAKIAPARKTPPVARGKQKKSTPAKKGDYSNSQYNTFDK